MFQNINKKIQKTNKQKRKKGEEIFFYIIFKLKLFIHLFDYRSMFVEPQSVNDSIDIIFKPNDRLND